MAEEANELTTTKESSDHQLLVSSAESLMHRLMEVGSDTTSSTFMLQIKEKISSIMKILEQKQKANAKFSTHVMLQLTTIFMDIISTCGDYEIKNTFLMGKLEAMENFQLANAQLINDTNVKVNLMLKRQDEQPTIVKGVMTEKVLTEDDPVLVIDTAEDEGALSYRDALKGKKDLFKDKTITDVIVPRPNRLLIKLSNSSDVDSLHKSLEEDLDLKEKAVITTSKRRRNRMIAMGLPGEMEEELIKNELEDHVGQREIEIVKRFPMGNIQNVIFNVDNISKGILMEKGKIIMDMMRVRIREYVQIIRCFKCWKAGHMARNCGNTRKCGNCGGVNHDMTTCDQEQSCYICKTRSHQTSDKKCPNFLNYKNSRLKLVPRL